MTVGLTLDFVLNFFLKFGRTGAMSTLWDDEIQAIA